MTGRVLVLGGRGVFGSRVVEALRVAGHEVVAPGRAVVDVTRAETLAPTLDGIDVVACCAGPFSSVDARCVEMCSAAGAAWVDIADDRAFCARVRGLDGTLRRHGTAAVYGASSLPGVSGALAIVARTARPDAPSAARVVLFIGNKNPKGRGALTSALGAIGAATGSIELPPPFGRQRVAAFDAADHDLLPSLLGTPAVDVGVAFEVPLAGAALRWLGPRAAPVLGPLGRMTSWLGHTGGGVVVELTWPDGARRRATLWSAEDGQRVAFLPCVVAVERLLADDSPVGALTAYGLLGAQPLLDALEALGLRLTFEPG